MFGFFRKNKSNPVQASSSTPPPFSPPAGDKSATNKGPILEAVIVHLNKTRDERLLPAFLEALSHRTVTILLQQPGKIQTALLLEYAGDQLIAVFTKPQLSEKWQAQGYPHLMDIPMVNLAAQVTSDKVGLTINPDHPIFSYPVTPALFKHFRDVAAKLRPALKEGGLYHARNEDGTFSVLKILKLDDKGVHIRQYSNQYTEPPAAVDESTLYMLGMDRKPEEKPGMGHLPISKNAFAGWSAVFFQQSTVSEKELEGYKMWLEAKGGYF